MTALVIAARTLRREWRLADLRTLALALVLAVAALGVVATLAARVEDAVVAGAAELIGADAGYRANATLPAAMAERAQALGLSVTRSASFASMAFAGERSQLVDVTAAGATWPLRGKLELRGRDGQPFTAHAPARGEVYLDQRALTALDSAVGNTVQLGGSPLRVAAELVSQPDGGQLVALAPRAVMNLADAEAAGLLGVGSRADHALLVAGDANRVHQWLDWSARHAPSGSTAVTPASVQERLRRAFDRAGAFLRLTALLAALLAGVAIALATQRYARRKTDEVALLRALGAPRRRVLAILAWSLVLLALPALLIGAGVALALAEIAWLALGHLFGNAQVGLPLLPVVASAAAGAAVLVGFAVPPLARLAKVPPVAVFRRDTGSTGRGFFVWYLLPIAVAAVLARAAGSSWQLALTVTASLVGVAAVAWLLAASLLALARRIAPNAHPALRLGLAALARRRRLSLVQAVALAMGLTALLLLGVIAPTLLDGWRRELPADTPNWFVLNLQSEQRAGFTSGLAAAGGDQLNMLPLAVGKLVAINGHAIDSLHFADPRAREWADRQLRVSWSTALPPANRVVGGQWFASQPAVPEVSIDTTWRDRFDLKLGDRLRLDVGGTTLEAQVTSVREVDWRSFRVNFFLLLDAAHGAELPHSWLASFHLPQGDGDRLAALSRTYPNLNLIDVDGILDRIRGIVDQVAGAVRWVLLFSLLAGALVLAAALAASAAERRHEAALLRTLGAERRQLHVAAACEFALLGIIAGAVSIVGAAAGGWWLARGVFDLEAFAPPWWRLVTIAAAAALAITLLGLAGTRQVAWTPPLNILRRG